MFTLGHGLNNSENSAVQAASKLGLHYFLCRINATPVVKGLKLPTVYKNADHSSFEWPLYTDFNVKVSCSEISYTSLNCSPYLSYQ